jgi:acetolactate synthase-1/2/3 large subunit
MSRFDQLADDIQSIGTKVVFGIPGSGATLSIIDALESRGIDFHLTQFEGSGVLMAGTYGHLSGRSGLSLSIKGPGLTNSIPGLAACSMEAFPLIHLAEAAAPNAPASQAHKRIDQNSLCSTVTKGSCYLPPSGKGFKTMSAWAEAEEPGPVLIQLAEKTFEGVKDIPRPTKCTVPLNQIVSDIIRNAKRPVIIAGALAVRKQWEVALSTLHIPVFSTASAKGVIDETLNHSAGVYTGVGLSLTPEYHLIPQSDLVIGIGLTAREVLAVNPFNCKSINIEAVNTPGTEAFEFTARIRVDDFVEVVSLLKAKNWGLHLLEASLAALRSRMFSDFLPGIIFHSIESRFSGMVRMVLDTGYFCTIGEHAWRAKRSDLCLLSGQSRYMGTCLPMAIGAAIYDKSIPTIAVVGDGGIGMFLSDIKLAVRLKLPLLLILMTDNSFGSIRTRAIKDGLTQKPLIMDGGSWVSVLEAFGVPGVRTESLAAFENSIACWKISTGPAYIEISFHQDNYQNMVQNIR